MTLSSRARSISQAADALATELAEPASKPRKHVVTVVWCEGDEPDDAGISSSIYDTQSLGKDLVFALQAINSAMGQPSSDSDAAKARAALVRAAKRDVYKLMTDGKWYMRHGARPRDTKAEAVSDNCEWLGCFIDPAEVEAILKGGADT